MVRLKINGRFHTVDASPDMPLLWVRSGHRAHEIGSARPLGLDSGRRAHDSAAVPRQVRGGVGGLGQRGHALPVNGILTEGRRSG